MSIPRSRSKDRVWAVRGTANPDGSVDFQTDNDIMHALLMDIRDELKALNAVMQCPNVMKGFVALQRIDKRLAKKVKLP